MSASIYDQHAAAFANVSAFVIVKDGERVATVAIKFPKDGAGRLWAYVHVLGAPMVRGYANGYGYDKRSAAVASAAGKLNPSDHVNAADAKHDPGMIWPSHAHCVALKAAMGKDDGYDWTRNVEDAGYQVFQAV